MLGFYCQVIDIACGSTCNMHGSYAGLQVRVSYIYFLVYAFQGYGFDLKDWYAGILGAWCWLVWTLVGVARIADLAAAVVN